MSVFPLELFHCPTCGSSTLVDSDVHLRCTSCTALFRRAGAIPVLTSRPAELMDEWCFEAAELVADNEEARNNILAQLSASRLHPRTRARLQHLHATLPEHRDRLLGLLATAGIVPRPRTRPDRPRVPGEGTITAYYHQVHRDWGWEQDGSAENANALAAVERVLVEPVSLGTVLVLGAGACRLSVDLHRSLGADRTVAIDLNPLPFLIADRLLRGEHLRLFELPFSPRSSSHTVVDRELVVTGSVPSDFHLLFADGLQPPVRPGAFDTVLTPWFIDQVPPDLAQIFPVIRNVLRDGGRWINHGPLVYHPNHTSLAHRYRVDEVLAMTEEAGFRIRAHEYVPLPYMHSPADSQGRSELVLSFDAEKGERSSVVEEQRPSWLDGIDLPVPRLEGFDGYRAPHPMFAAIVDLVDGQRSIRDIAEILVARHGVPKNAATFGVQTCLAEVLRSLQQ